MKIDTKFLAAVFFALSLGLSATAQYTLTDSDVVVTNGIIESCSYDFAVSGIIIPSTLDGQTVTGIANKETYGVFYNKGITNITLPATIETIGDYAFYNNNLINLDLSACANLSYIGAYAFVSNELISLNLSACTALLTIGDYAFASNALPGINISACTALMSIGAYAFYNNTMSSITLPVNTVYEVSGWKDNSGAVHNGGDVVNDFETFYDVPIYTLIDNDVVVVNGIIESCSYGFYRKNLIIPEILDGQTVTGIADESLSDGGIFGDKGLVNVILPATIETIGDYAFYNNYLTNIDLSACSSLIRIGFWAFNYNTSMEMLDLTPCSSLTYIGKGVSANNAIKTIVLPVNTEYEEYGWKDAKDSLYAGGDVVSSFDAFFYVPIPYTLSDEDVVMKDGMIDTCTYNFALTNIIIPETLDGQAVVGIASKVFQNKNITGLTLPATIEIIGSYAFDYNYLNSLDLTACNALTTIEWRAFYRNSLSSIDFSACTALTSIGGNAFCINNLTSIDLSSCIALTSIATSAFSQNQLTSINLNSCTALASIGSYAFSQNKLPGIDLSACTALTFIGKEAFYMNFLTSFSIPTPDIPGYLFNNWIDESNTTYDGGVVVSDNLTSYTADLTATGYELTFTVTDGTNPITGATVNLGVYGNAISDTIGVAIFLSVDPVSDLAYTVTAKGYDKVSGTISVSDGGVSESATLIKSVTGVTRSSEISLKLYPNPATDIIYLQMAEKALVCMFDLSGKLVLSYKTYTDCTIIPVGELSAGNYIIKIETGNKTVSKMVIIE